MTDWGLHLYYNNRSLKARKGFPWNLSENAGLARDYSQGACPAADSLFERSLLLAIPSCLTEQDEDDIIRAFEKGTGSIAMNRVVFLFASLAYAFSAAAADASDEKPIYLDPKRPREERIDDLLRRMTLAEKAGQMNMPCVYLRQLARTRWRSRTAAGGSPWARSPARSGLVAAFSRWRTTLSRLARENRRSTSTNCKQVIVPEDEFRNPIDVGALAWFLLRLINQPDASGVYHLGSSDVVSRYDLVTEFARRMHYSPDLVIRQREPVPGRAPRGRDHFLISDKIAALCGRPVPTSQQALERCLHAIAQSRS